ncbi:E3 ubiquitin-protein ligase RSL1-like [Primulina eburnea]|uniref:E3 ubiquitin-protein ligase RSL1-like n=1 Tax=Primulina eburnea TaxID=1245227 RepID=UPI003C6BF5E0
MSELMEEASISLFCDDSYLCLLSNSSSEESADNGTLMSDEKFAEELQFQETLMASIITSNTPRGDSPPKESKEAGESSKSFCEICAERRENDQMFPIQNCSHSCCITCITRYIAANITKMGNVHRENCTVLTCPVGLHCEGILEIDACREIVPNDLISAWDYAICESMIDDSQKFYCPYKDCSYLMVNDSGDFIREAECLSCRRLLCVQCNAPWHSGVGCEEFNGMDASERGREDLLMHQLAKEKKWQRCPTCKFFVEKTEGCLHMICRCGFQFCYECGGTWTSTHGDCR